MTRYTCGFSHVYLRSFLLGGVFYSQVYDHFLTNAHIYAHKKAHIYALQTSMWLVYGVTESRRIRGTELYRHQKAPSCTMDLKINFSLNQAWPPWPRIFRVKVWFLFIALTVVVVVGSPTTALLESVDCLLRDCVRYFTNTDRNNHRFS